MRRLIVLILLVLITLLVACSETPTPEILPTATPASSQHATPSPTPVDPFSIRPPSFDRYCANSDANAPRNPAEPPEPFMFQPHTGAFSAAAWTAQMDQATPTYQIDGQLAALGEVFGDGSGFGNIRAYESPALESLVYYDGHDGNDFGVTGPALSVADGRVAYMGIMGLLGRVVEIYHPNGYLTRYAHLASYAANLKVGMPVKAGDEIGTIGGSGFDDGKLNDAKWDIHLHFTVFHWNASRNTWEITDPFGWDPWVGPDEQRNQVQLADPLFNCNNEISYNLWVGYVPQPHQATSQQASLPNPTNGRYLGGWLGEVSSNDIPPASSKVPELDLQSSESVLEQVMYAVVHNDSSLLEPLIPEDGVYYAVYVEGRKPVSKVEVLEDLAVRLPSYPRCDQYMIDEHGDLAQIWFSGWYPLWTLDWAIYVEKIVFDPPIVSGAGALFFDKNEAGHYIKAVWIGNYEEVLWEYSNLTNYPCPEGEGIPDPRSEDLTSENALESSTLIYLDVDSNLRWYNAGTDESAILSEAEEVTEFSISPRSNRIFYMDSTGTGHIVALRRNVNDEVSAQKVAFIKPGTTDYGNVAIGWHPDGTSLYYEDRFGESWIAYHDGTIESLPPETATSTAWSYDNEYWSSVRENVLWVGTTEGDAVQVAANISRARWSPTQPLLAYTTVNSVEDPFMADDPEGCQTYVYDVVERQSYLVTSKGRLSHWFPDGNALVIERVLSIGVHGGESQYMVAGPHGEPLLDVAIAHTDFPVIACPATDARLIGPWEVDLTENRVWTVVEAGYPIDWSSDGRYALVLEGNWGSLERNLYFFDRLNNNYRHLFISYGGLGAVEGTGVSGYLSPRATWARIIAAVADTFDREVLLARTDGREIITAPELPGNWNGSITFSTDDRWAVYGSQNGWALIDLETRTTHTIPEVGSQWPVWLRGER